MGIKDNLRKDINDPQMTPEEWIQKNTVRCPVGRVSQKTCEQLRARPRPSYTFEQTVGRHWHNGNLSELTRPPECDDCPGWENIKQKGKNMETVTKKRCSRCGKMLPLSEFHKDASTHSGYKSHCKACVSKSRRDTTKRFAELEQEKMVLLTRLTQLKEQIKRRERAVEELVVALETSWATKVEQYSSNADFDRLLRKMGKIHDEKRVDYASNNDPLGNFRESEKVGVEAWRSILIRMTDKYSRICNLARNGEPKVKDESMEDTLLDLANYSLLCILARKV